MSKCKTCGAGCFPDRNGECRKCREATAKRLTVEEAERRAAQRQFFLDHKHCGACGGPGAFCTCRQPCPCADLHEVGSGLRDGALDAFAEGVSVDQGGFWDV